MLEYWQFINPEHIIPIFQNSIVVRAGKNPAAKKKFFYNRQLTKDNLSNEIHANDSEAYFIGTGL